MFNDLVVFTSPNPSGDSLFYRCYQLTCSLLKALWPPIMEALWIVPVSTSTWHLSDCPTWNSMKIYILNLQFYERLSIFAYISQWSTSCHGHWMPWIKPVTDLKVFFRKWLLKVAFVRKISHVAHALAQVSTFESQLSQTEQVLFLKVFFCIRWAMIGQ